MIFLGFEKLGRYFINKNCVSNDKIDTPSRFYLLINLKNENLERWKDKK